MKIHRAEGVVIALTMGVEEEFLLVDPLSRETVPRAAAVLARLARPHEGAGPVAHAFHRELLSTQVEAVTGVCEDVPGLRGQLVDARRELAVAAGAEGLRPVSTGTPVMPCPDPPVTEGERFGFIARTYEAVVRGYQCCGCHVHIGVPDRETAVAVINHLRPWLPTLLALSANSPFDRGRDTGYASWRMMEQARFPGSGVPPHFSSAAAYDRQLERLVDSGILADAHQTFWLARPSSHLPTVEIRSADAALTVDHAVLQAALTRGLVRAALDDLAAGREAARISDQICAAAVWSAARHGSRGPAVHPLEERQVPAARLTSELLGRIGGALEESGDLTEVITLLERLEPGAERQRRSALDGGLPGAVDMLIKELE